MMTVAHLIRILEEMPQDANIELEVIDLLGYSHSTDAKSAIEIFEDIHGNIIVQGIN